MAIKRKNINMLSHGRPMKNAVGFSLVEMAIAMAIVAILALIAAPGFQRWQHGKRLRSAAREIYSAMQQARMGAVRTGEDWAVWFDTAGNRFYLYSGTGADNNMGSSADPAALADNPGMDMQVPARPVYLAGKDLDTDDDGVNDLIDVSNVRYGRGPRALAGGGVNGETIDNDFVGFAGEIVTFSPTGAANSGYVYLDHCPDPVNPGNSANDDACNSATAPVYAVGTLTSGMPVVRRWLNGRWNQ